MMKLNKIRKKLSYKKKNKKDKKISYRISTWYIIYHNNKYKNNNLKQKNKRSV